MAHGGARPRSGPPPDPNALRRDRSNDGEWITLPAVRSGPVPDWPLTIPPSEAETTHWDNLWRTPQATQWEVESAEVEVALYVRCLALAEIPGAPVGLIKEVRLMQENLGLSLGSMLRHRWKVADAAVPVPAATATPSPAAARPASRGKSSRERFRVVKPVEGT